MLSEVRADGGNSGIRTHAYRNYSFVPLPLGDAPIYARLSELSSVLKFRFVTTDADL